VARARRAELVDRTKPVSDSLEEAVPFSLSLVHLIQPQTRITGVANAAILRSRIIAWTARLMNHLLPIIYGSKLCSSKVIIFRNFNFPSRRGCGFVGRESYPRSKRLRVKSIACFGDGQSAARHVEAARPRSTEVHVRQATVRRLACRLPEPYRTPATA
jgi:hypothetical protein